VDCTDHGDEDVGCIFVMEMGLVGCIGCIGCILVTEVNMCRCKMYIGHGDKDMQAAGDVNM
jgi:hypothetical protein